ncbi:hypothetical protein ZIOFF_043480 [Zingiber officinale]|uniref:J domain-containing protein n=1 Tax=Zingiber officinale TaxID=94328 RepID=A0A8J5KU08_ZINOF|nr:hypothetical protein ZIOFF_043480 [Zingiber officinale]
MAATFLAHIKRYSLPLILFGLGFFFQLVVLPKSFPPTYYDVLHLKRNASVEEVDHSYHNLMSKFAESDPPITNELIKIRYAFELLTNPLWKRDYDLFGIDEYSHVINNVKDRYRGGHFSEIELPIINLSSLGMFIVLLKQKCMLSDVTNNLTPMEFISTVGKSKPLLIQIYSSGSLRCAEFIRAWKRIESLLEGVAETGMVELGDLQLSSYLAETAFAEQPYFRNGVPSLVAFPSNCTNTRCIERYHDEFSVDSILDWMATNILGLPRILYYSKETLAKFIATSGRHKVKVICFSKTGERAAPFIRQAAKEHFSEASFAYVLWREVDMPFWWNMFGVDSAPSVVLLKDIYSKPVTYSGSFNHLQLVKMMDDYKKNDIPQLRTVSSMELGCDARGYSRAGNETVTWYCLILIGRAGHAMTQMRETLRRASDVLMVGDDSDYARNVNLSVASVASAAMKENRLTFTWLDGEVQQKYCQFHLAPEYHTKSCGPSYEDGVDVPQILIVRYLRNSTDNNAENDRWKHFRNQYLGDTNVASQLIARYPGPEDVEELIQWISQIVERGDTREFPYFAKHLTLPADQHRHKRCRIVARLKVSHGADNAFGLVARPDDESERIVRATCARGRGGAKTFETPDLVPEDKQSTGSPVGQSFRRGINYRFKNLRMYISDLPRDPRIGPILLLTACLLFGTIWLQNNRTTQANTPDNSTSNTSSRRRPWPARTDDVPSSMTDEEPKDAYQLLKTDSDSE